MELLDGRFVLYSEHVPSELSTLLRKNRSFSAKSDFKITSKIFSVKKLLGTASIEFLNLSKDWDVPRFA